MKEYHIRDTISAIGVSNPYWKTGMIFSASRRTDIPAFYGEWFINRLRAKEIAVRNPMNVKQVTLFKFDPTAIDCLVFWTKNVSPFLRYLSEIDSLGYKYYFQYTLTAYGNEIEKNLDKSKMPDTFKELSARIGKEKVIWRYDPIFVNKKYSVLFHTEHFAELAGQLNGYTEKCVISFIDRYSFLNGNFAEFQIEELKDARIEEITRKLCQVTRQCSLNLQITTCCEKIDLGKYNIQHNKCINDDLIARITGRQNNYKKDPSQRKECGCAASRDIGAYNSCLHDCIYCYAKRGGKNKNAGDTRSIILCDAIDSSADMVKVIDLREPQPTLF